MAARSCDQCGARMSPFQPRKRLPSGDLVCRGCEAKPTLSTAASTATASTGPRCEFRHEGEAPAAAWRVYGPLDSDEMFTVCEEHKESAKRQFSGRAPIVERIEPKQAARVVLASGRTIEYLGDRIAGFKVAHDSGDGETIYHCPFCGAGQVVGRSDGTAECGFCKTSFTVQVQPQRAAVPQTIDGVPHVHPDMPGSTPGLTPGQSPEDPAEQATETTTTEVPTEEPKMFASRRYYVAADGLALPEEAYLKHIALRFADDPAAVLAHLRGTE